MVPIKHILLSVSTKLCIEENIVLPRHLVTLSFLLVRPLRLRYSPCEDIRNIRQISVDKLEVQHGSDRNEIKHPKVVLEHHPYAQVLHFCISVTEYQTQAKSIPSKAGVSQCISDIHPNRCVELSLRYPCSALILHDKAYHHGLLEIKGSFGFRK